MVQLSTTQWERTEYPLWGTVETGTRTVEYPLSTVLLAVFPQFVIQPTCDSAGEVNDTREFFY